jgi:hypothetical protein
MNPSSTGADGAAALRDLERQVAVAWLSMGGCVNGAHDGAVVRVTVLDPMNSNAVGVTASRGPSPFPVGACRQ